MTANMIQLVTSHGRMMEPPARNTMWRFGFPTRANYEDSELFCGGIKRQWDDNNGQCGVCGDPYDGEREHETGGFYAYNVTARKYAPGAAIDILIDIVANHGGRFSFQMCWRDTWEQKETESCFEPLRLANGNYSTELDPKSGTGTKLYQVQLPPNKECENCILRWHWKSANNWGKCEDGDHQVGCGPQETYRNCGDIAVKHDLGVRGVTDVKNNGVDGKRVHW